MKLRMRCEDHGGRTEEQCEGAVLVQLQMLVLSREKQGVEKMQINVMMKFYIW
jgi:hypothetical protein